MPAARLVLAAALALVPAAGVAQTEDAGSSRPATGDPALDALIEELRSDRIDPTDPTDPTDRILFEPVDDVDLDALVDTVRQVTPLPKR
jgi:hypothetical protein